MTARLPAALTVSAAFLISVTAPSAAAAEQRTGPAEQTSVRATHLVAVPAPTVTSAEYPADGAIHDGVGRSGSFGITAGAGGRPPYGFGYRFTPPGGPAEPVGRLILGRTGGCGSTSCTIAKTPDARGDWTLNVWAVNRVGWRSSVVTHRFRVGQAVAAGTHWRLEDPAGSTTLHEELGSGDAYQAHLSGTDFSLGHHARVGSDALKLNADSDPATRGYAETRLPAADPAKSYSVSAWVKAAADDRSATVVGQEGMRTTAFGLQQTADGHWAMSAVPGDGEAAGLASQVRSTEPLKAGQWTQLAGVHDASTKTIKLYVDGLLQGSAAFDADGWATAGLGPFALGRGLTAGVKDGFFAGEIDDVRVLGKAATDAEVAGWYRPTVQARWRLNAPAGADVTVEDDTGAGNDLTLNGGAEIKNDGPTCEALTGRCLALDGAGEDGAGEWAETGGPVIRTDRSFTISGWAGAADTPTVPMTVFSAAGAEQSAFTVRFNPRVARNPNYDPDIDDPSFEYIKGWEIEMPDRDGSSPVRTTAYHGQSCNVCTGAGPDHLALVYEAKTGTMTLYVNGNIEQNENNVSSKTGVVGFQATGPLQIGRRLADGGTAADDRNREYFSGLIDDVWVLKGALTAGEIATMNNLGEVDSFHGNPQLP